MKNWKVSARLTIAFTVVVLLAFIISSIGYLGMRSMTNANKQLYEKNVIGLASIGHICTNLQQQRISIRSILLYASGSEESAESLSQLGELESQMEEYIQMYLPTITAQEDQETFDRVLSKYYGEFAETKKTIRRLVDSDRLQSSSQLLTTVVLDQALDQDLDACYNYNVQNADAIVSRQEALFLQYVVYQAVTLLFAVAASVGICLMLNHHIAKPLRKMAGCAVQIADGDMNFTLDVYSKDEVGELADAFRHMAARIKSHAMLLVRISQGDLSEELAATGEQDMVANSIRAVSDSLNRVLHEILAVSERVSTGANQVSDGSQVLAQGTSEQATAIEQLSSSIFEISLNTKENAKMAEKAAELYTGIRERAQESTELMKEMMRAVEEINEASGNISKIIRLINDISFQTNILSLNAAVEAANAGQHGKGFAVVAGEVRNLAAKSSQAATDTDVLIENSMEKARLGASIAKKTQSALDDIVADILRSAELINDIAKASSEQALGVEQINVGIDQVAQVVNMNSSTAEHSATAAEEMAAQAGVMERLVASFKLKPLGERTSQEVLARIPPAHAPGERRKKEKKPVIVLQEHSEKY